MGDGDSIENMAEKNKSLCEAVDRSIRLMEGMTKKLKTAQTKIIRLEKENQEFQRSVVYLTGRLSHYEMLARHQSERDGFDKTGGRILQDITPKDNTSAGSVGFEVMKDSAACSAPPFNTQEPTTVEQGKSISNLKEECGPPEAIINESTNVVHNESLSPENKLFPVKRPVDSSDDSDEDEYKTADDEEGEQDEEEEEDEDMEVADTYANYVPAKLTIGQTHPDAVVETASLSSVEPPNVWLPLSLPTATIESGALSALQLEAVTYACQRHSHCLPDGTRCGYLIGDGAGVGKGRTIAGCIYENYLKGHKKAIWVSVSTDLKYDSERDLRDIGATEVAVYHLNKMKYGAQLCFKNKVIKEGIIFSTYSSLIGSSKIRNTIRTRLNQLLDWCGKDFEGVIVFDECHRAKNLCPHKGKPTKTGKAVLELQQKLPKARVVYASATGATEPRNMAYMSRLGMWGEGTPFPKFTDFKSAVEKRGVGAMEIVAMDMKLRGMYIARQLSFDGVQFKIQEVPLTPDFIQVYNNSVELWVEALKDFQTAAGLMPLTPKHRKSLWCQFWSAHQRFFKYLCISAKVKEAVNIARSAVKSGKCVVIGLQSTGEARTLDQLEADDGEAFDFVSSAKGVLTNLVEKQFPAPDNACFSFSLKLGVIHHPVDVNVFNFKKDVSNGAKRKPATQAVSSNVCKKMKREGAMSYLYDEPSCSSEPWDYSSSDSSSEVPSFDSDSFDFDSDEMPIERTVRLMNKQLDKRSKDNLKKPRKPTQKKKRENTAIQLQPNSSTQDPEKVCCELKKKLLMKIEDLGTCLPCNTLDQLIDELGGPEVVAEMTGRKGRLVQNNGEMVQYETRAEVDITLEAINLKEKKRFMDGDKLIAIISEAASSGISLHSDKRERNQRKRVHITLELPWSADRAVQQFGRTHRSNQVNPPEYIFLISDLAGERRFASIVARRLECLGALTHGDRRATETRDLSGFNFNNRYGLAALKSTMNAIAGYAGPLAPLPHTEGDFCKDVSEALEGVGMETVKYAERAQMEYSSVSKFLNRILGLPVKIQNSLFQFYLDTLKQVIKNAKKTGRYDVGILDLSTAGENVRSVRSVTFRRRHATGLTTVDLHILRVNRGMSWKEAMAQWIDLTGMCEGFYISNQARNGKITALLAVSIGSGDDDEPDQNQLFTIYRPNTGLQLKQETLAELESKYKLVPFCDAEKHWIHQYESSEKICSHAYWSGHCKLKAEVGECEVGLRQRTFNVLCGSVINVWARVEAVLKNKRPRMQVVRIRTAEDKKIVGTLIPKSAVNPLHLDLASDSEKVDVKTF